MSSDIEKSVLLQVREVHEDVLHKDFSRAKMF